MQNWLLDNLALITILLSIVTLAFVFVWWRTRRRPYALGAVTAVTLLGLVWLLLYALPLLFGETDSQQIERKIRAMAAAVKTRDLDRIFSHISESFHFGSHDKAAFRRRSEEVIRAGEVEEVIVWDFQRGDIARDQRTGKISFMVKARASWRGSEAGYRCDADFVLDSDGQWRMGGFQLFNPFRESKEPIPLPRF
jgi:hypothetical protein